MIFTRTQARLLSCLIVSLFTWACSPTSGPRVTDTTARVQAVAVAAEFGVAKMQDRYLALLQRLEAVHYAEIGHRNPDIDRLFDEALKDGRELGKMSFVDVLKEAEISADVLAEFQSQNDTGGQRDRTPHR